MEKKATPMRLRVTYSGKQLWIKIPNDNINFAQLKKLLIQHFTKSGPPLTGDFVIADTEKFQLDSNPDDSIQEFLTDKSQVVLIPANTPIEGPPTPDPAASSISAQTSKPTQDAITPSSQSVLQPSIPPLQLTTIQSVEDEKEKSSTHLSALAQPETEQKREDTQKEPMRAIEGRTSYFDTLSDLQRAQIHKRIPFYSNACRSNE
jgi:hypothetical protein